MSISKIFCLGDGFAHGHIWPEWPQILSALAPSHSVICLSGIGAGAEYLVDALLQHDVFGHTVIFQWPYSQRFDKLLEHESWEDLRRDDPVYVNNVYQSGQHRWWLTSASSVPDVKKYHDFYIGQTQADLRVQNLQILVRGYLQWQDCRYLETSTQAQDEFSHHVRFQHRRGNEVQPQPWVHYCWVRECLLPVLGVEIQESRLNHLGEILDHEQWNAYDPDRDDQWRRIVNTLD
jgi:hypothetical protein